MDYNLQIFKKDFKADRSSWSYRFVVVDNNRSLNYPANFVCMLPIKPNNVKTKGSNVFGVLFGDKSAVVAIGLLNKALKKEKDANVIVEIEKRIKLMNPKQVNKVKCFKCKKEFTPQYRRFKRYLCNDCLGYRNTT